MNPAAPLGGWAISLDLWGTLITSGDRPAAMNWRITEFGRILRYFGHDIADCPLRETVLSADARALREQRARGTQPPADGQVTSILRALDIPARTDLVHVLGIVHEHAALRACPEPQPGARTALDGLSRTGARIVLTSNTLSTPGTVTTQILDDLGLTGYFDDMLFSGDFAVAKPRPEVFTAIARRADTPPGRVIHVGDDWDTDVRGALSAGCRAVYYHPGSPARPGAPGITRLDQLAATVRDTARSAPVSLEEP